MTPEDQKSFLKAVGIHIANEVKAATIPLRQRIEELETRLSNFRYAGVWCEGNEYRTGNFVTHDGSLFHCNLPTKNRPGKDNVSWSLCVKRGQDGKDFGRQVA